MSRYTRVVHFHGDEYRVFCNFPDGIHKSEPMPFPDTDLVAHRLNLEACKAWRFHNGTRRVKRPFVGWTEPRIEVEPGPVETSNRTDDGLWKFANSSPDFDNFNLQNGGE